MSGENKPLLTSGESPAYGSHRQRNHEGSDCGTGDWHLEDDVGCGVGNKTGDADMWKQQQREAWLSARRRARSRARTASSRRSRHLSWVSDPGTLLAARGLHGPEEDGLAGEVQQEGDGEEEEVTVVVEKVQLQRTLTLAHAVVFIIVNVTGTGIFITPTGVTQGVGSVGATIITWTLCGLYNLLLALCYAELGTAFPVAGGDYSYIQQSLGPLPGFLCLYIYVFMGPVAAAVSSRIVGEYLLPVLGLQCHYTIVVLVAVFFNLCFAGVNAVTVRGTARALVVFTVIKVAAFAVIIVIGLVNLGQGRTQNFTNMFEGSILDPGSIALGVIPGFVSYCGWDMVCSLVGEMKNPKRDLPLCLVIAISLVTAIYVLMNVAYFTVLTPAEFIASNAVGVSFAARTVPGAAWLLPVFVALSALGSLHSEYLAMPRYTYAGAKDKQLPEVLGFLSINYYTPVPAIGLQLVLSLFFASSTFFDIQGLFLLLGVNLQLKVGVALVGLLYVKLRRPDLPRSLQVPLPVVVLCLLLIVVITALAVIADPVTNGIGCLIFLAGIPLYYLGQAGQRSAVLSKASGHVTLFLQRLLLVVPSEADDNGEDE